MFNRKAMFSSATLDASTPKAFFDELDKEFHFDLDPCTTKDNPMGTPYFYTKEDDGLNKEWSKIEHGNGYTSIINNVFVNPPYGREISKWVKAAYTRSRCYKITVVMLIASRTDTKWWHDYVMKADEIRFIKGRLKFGSHNNSAPFPSCIVIFGPEHKT